ncbi:hypothetical protein ABZZ17_24855 [Streptomyces sp. NPDC006512]|uniref:hypothetical protein n=1 Tax=Streptomyces sp. NPDC006512 TaxID=3154307 RepID=UPI0033A38FFD
MTPARRSRTADLGERKGDLLLSRRQAEEEPWLGEIDGIDTHYCICPAWQAADPCRQQHGFVNEAGTPDGDPRPRARHMKTWTSVIAGLAGIITLGFFLWDRYVPHPPTVKEWAVQANTICDKQIKGLQEASNKVNESLKAFDVAMSKVNTPESPTGDEIVELINRAAQDLDSFSGTERQTKADLDGIERPEDHAQQVDRLIEAMNEMSQKDTELSQYFRKIGESTIPDRKRFEIEEERNKLVEEVDGTLKELGAKQCLI